MTSVDEKEDLTSAHSAGFILVDAEVSDYDVIYETQKELVERRKAARGGFDYLIFVEHPSVYTYGRKTRPTPETLPGNARTFEIERGGEATYHNEGQLVCYPILKLEDRERDLHLHLRRLEEALIDVLRDFGISGERRKGATGVWIVGENKKIASIGVAVSGWVTYHGCALNVNNDLSGFGKINPCGFNSDVMTSMRDQLGDKCPPMADVKESFLGHFSLHFHRFLVI